MATEHPQELVEVLAERLCGNPDSALDRGNARFDAAEILDVLSALEHPVIIGGGHRGERVELWTRGPNVCCGCSLDSLYPLGEPDEWTMEREGRTRFMPAWVLAEAAPTTTTEAVVADEGGSDA